MTRILLLPTLILLLLGGIFYYASAGDAVTTPPDVVYASEADINTLDMHNMSWHQDIRAAMALYEGLLAYHPTALTPTPGVASSWTISPDGRTYTFTLRPDARWSNGDPVTAHDFRRSWQRALDPATPTEYRTLFYLIEGAQAWEEAVARARKDNAPEPNFDTVGIRTPDDHTLAVTLANPCPYFLDLMCFVTFYPVHLDSMQPFLLDPANPHRGYKPEWTHAGNLVSNGPFHLKEWVFKQHLLFEANPHYWDKANVRSRRVKLVAYDDQQAAFLAYSTGVVDILSFVPAAFQAELVEAQRQGKRSDVHFTPTFGTYYYVFNCSRKPFDDPRVRRAFALVVDRKSIVENVTRMHQRPITSLTPPDAMPPYRTPRGLEPDIAKARALLAEAGYPDGKGFPEVDFLYNKTNPHLDVAQAVGQMWSTHLGVRVNYKGVEGKTFSADRRSSNFAIARGGWYGDYMDPTTWLDLAISHNPNNNGKFNDPAFDAMLAKAEKAYTPANPQPRLDLLHDAEQYLVQEAMPFLPLFQYSNGYMYDAKTLKGAEPNIRLMVQLKYIEKTN